MAKASPGPSSSTATDSGTSFTVTEDMWSHTRETVTMLYLAICQIETSIAESNQSVQQLTDTFTRLAAHTLKEKEGYDQSYANKVRFWSNQEVQDRINEAITAFQFYDRISQRLDHVSAGLEKLTEMFHSQDKLNDPNSWKQIQDEVKSSYSMECERLMFEQIMDGATVQEALATYQQLVASQQQQRQQNDDIELF